jgi:hypothetical protein
VTPIPATGPAPDRQQPSALGAVPAIVLCSRRDPVLSRNMTTEVRSMNPPRQRTAVMKVTTVSG